VIAIVLLNERSTFHTELLRHYLLSRFLNLYRQDFDRLVTCDLEDTFVQGDKFTIRFKAKTLGLPLTSRPASWRALLSNVKAIDMFSDLRFSVSMDGISDKLIHGSVPLVLRLNEIVMKQRNASLIFEKLKFLPRIGTPGDDFSFATASSTITGPSDIAMLKSVCRHRPVRTRR
jgi:hypothetical protein